MVERASRVVATPGVRAVVLIDGTDVVYKQLTVPAFSGSYFHGFSMGKTVTAMAAGKAICDGKLALTTVAADVVPQLKGTYLGGASLGELLTMTSGATPGDWSGEVYSKEQSAERDRGKLKFIDAMASPSISGQERGVFASFKHGEHFVYKNSDPNVVGLMLTRSTGVPYAEWLQAEVFEPMGIAQGASVVQDGDRDGQAEGGVRMQLDDWIRFALWVKESSKEPGCFGDFVRNATKKQVQNGPTRRVTGKAFAGYGYFVWTDNEYTPNSYWASGYGGQRIGWSTQNDRTVIVFSTTEAPVLDFYALQAAWASASGH